MIGSRPFTFQLLVFVAISAPLRLSFNSNARDSLPRNLRSLGETSVLRDKPEQEKLVDVERGCREELIHKAQQCIRLMNFTQE